MKAENVLNRLRFRYDAEILRRRSIDGSGFGVVSEENVTGRRDFDVQVPEHILTLTPDGPPTWVEGRLDGKPLQRFPVRSGQLTLVPGGQRFRGHTDGSGTRGEVKLIFRPDLITLVSGTEINEARVGLVRSVALRNPMILHAMAALGREVEQSGVMGRVYAESLVVLILTELIRHHSTLVDASKGVEHLPSRRFRRVIDYIEAHLGEDLSLLTLAAEADASPAHFARGVQASYRPVGASVPPEATDRGGRGAAGGYGAIDRGGRACDGLP